MVGRRGLWGIGMLVASAWSVVPPGPALAEMDTVGVHEVMRGDSRAARRFVPVNSGVVWVSAPPALPATQPAMTPRRGAAANLGRGGPTGVCVRLCDGYAFPIGPVSTTSRAQAACEAGCPGAPVRLFTLRGSLEDLDNAVDAGGMTYRSLPAAFLHRTRRVADCSCQGADGIAARVPLERDATLRPGDVFVTPTSALAVVGAAEARRLVDFRRASSLTRNQRAQVDAKLGVSRREAEVRRFRQAFVAEGGRITVVEAPRTEPARAEQGTTGRTLAALAPSRGFQSVERAGGQFRVVR